ncbi:MAG: glycine cleavage system aminomethyltransferase GcvT, partial [bacterium]
MTEAEGPARRTPLYERHLAAGAKMVPFAGFEMPVQYTGVIEEHHAVRRAAGLFDVSHMGEFDVEGPGAGAFLQRLLSNNLKRLEVDRVMYTVMCREDGGIVDDLTVYRRGENRYVAVVNAANIEKDFEWMSSRKKGDCELRDASEETGLLALQGPCAEEILARFIPGGGDLGEIPYYGAQLREVAGREALVSRTGYTGEDGFELYCA